MKIRLGISCESSDRIHKVSHFSSNENAEIFSLNNIIKEVNISSAGAVVSASIVETSKIGSWN